jgi:small subunit ribosomal protein S9
MPDTTPTTTSPALPTPSITSATPAPRRTGPAAGKPVIGAPLIGATDAAAPEAKPLRAAKPADKLGWWWGTGRRKTAVARLRMRPADKTRFVVQLEGKDKFKTLDDYFKEERDRTDCVSPLKITNTENKFDIVVRLHGGGTMGQAQAVRLAVARALVNYDPSLYEALRDAGVVTRDAREVERKKYGQAGARRRFQFSKR